MSQINILSPFYTKFAKIDSSYLKMSGFSTRNVRCPRYQDTNLLSGLKVNECMMRCLIRLWPDIPQVITAN